MTDLINSINNLIVENKSNVEGIINKYLPVLKECVLESQYPYVAILIDRSVNFINANHQTRSSDWKAWAVLVVYKLYQDKKLENLNQIPEIINHFFTFKDSEYQNFCNDTISISEYHRDQGFVYRFYRKQLRAL